MKKIFALLLVTVMLFSFAACGKNKDSDDNGKTKQPSSDIVNSDVSNKTDSTVSDTTGSQDSLESSPSSSTAGDSDEETIKKFLESSEEELESMKETYAAMGLDISIEARGSAFVYVYRYAADIGTGDEIKDALDQTLESTASTFEMVLAGLQSECPAIKSVIVEYRYMDGTVITSKEFK